MSSNGTVDGLTLARKSVVPNLVKRFLQEGRLAHSFSIKLIANVDIVYYAAAAGYEAVLIDLEHSSFGLETCNQLSVSALSAGITPIVRVPANTSDWISRALDGGAQAIIVPHVNSAAEAANVVKYARFAPEGERSATSGMACLRYASIPAKYANVAANEETLVICMIETERAVEDVESIAAVPGVDVLLIGSSDLTSDMGIAGDYDSPRLADAYAKVSAACAKASVNGRLVSMGIGGLNGRPDLIEKLATAHANGRYAMSGADNAMMLAAMRAGAKNTQAMTARLSA
ncbi:hypothetical protein TREMEDRAFT_72636 [Tremella mesenterica DSM 1558]|uniref:uncharacterized protein n=1 Tax=Tremella mesenterica (strain ATCC 24925 / CBS 8224 / DSM 1558 / NBRC 9311 / NRRL Y-6157 / RJB 2259-6 / UBC 559-6) TaxID=578456 RepID=UPI0003F49109|nr:uncharacterized protein TREMEDRAFT_72636 [Tremella mesenterica DSM 1558]EIW72044.1 hypothetical protein TREMEDRAFT_72636 [Tremella mesenterica DSM 1558]